MDYESFKSVFLDALQQSRLPELGLGGRERVDPRSLERKFTVYVEPIARDLTPPFHVAGAVSFRWDALSTARMATTEEDLLMQLHGREFAARVETEPPSLRVDIELRAGLEWGKSLPMPGRAAWAGWIRETRGRLAAIERMVPEDVVVESSDGSLAILAWQGDPEIKLRCDDSGTLSLEQISIHAFQIIDLPRQWDDPDRETDADPYAALIELFERLRAALHAWSESADHLLPRPTSP